MSMKNKGFSLIELIVVMAVMAILVLLAAPKYVGQMQEGRYTTIINDVKVLGEMAEAAMYNHPDEAWPILPDAVVIPADVLEYLKTEIGDNTITSADFKYLDANNIDRVVASINGDIFDYAVFLKSGSGKTGQVYYIQKVWDDI